MTVKIYVSKDSENHARPPDKQHEIQGLLYLLKEMWKKYHHSHSFYGVVANMRFPCADLAIFTERGIGVLELKDYRGRVTVLPNGIWLADTSVIKGGNGYKNPHEQVQIYGEMMREKIIRSVFPNEKYRWDEIKLQTGVCFTNEIVNLSTIKKNIHLLNKDNEPWESSFDVMYPHEVTEWVLRLMFALNKERQYDYEPITVKPVKLDEVIKKNFNATEWEDMLCQMPQGNRYGYVVVQDGEDCLVNPLYLDETIIGRDENDCHITVPIRYTRVSNIHCRIVRTLEGVKVIDLHSRNGSFDSQGRRIREELLGNEQVLYLGGMAGEPGACVLRIQLGETSTRSKNPTMV